MATERLDCFSASVEAFLVVGEQRIRIAKTGPEEVVLVESRDLPRGAKGELEVTVDGHTVSRPITLPEGATRGRHETRYSETPSS